jgi:hypothetical protein
MMLPIHDCLGRGLAPYSAGSAYPLLPVSSGSASRAKPYHPIYFIELGVTEPRRNHSSLRNIKSYCGGVHPSA